MQEGADRIPWTRAQETEVSWQRAPLGSDLQIEEEEEEIVPFADD